MSTRLAVVLAVIAMAVVLMACGIDWRDECEKVGLVKRCVAVGQHDEMLMQIMMFDANGVPIFMPSWQTVTDYSCSCERAGGGK